MNIPRPALLTLDAGVAGGDEGLKEVAGGGGVELQVVLKFGVGEDAALTQEVEGGGEEGVGAEGGGFGGARGFCGGRRGRGLGELEGEGVVDVAVLDRGGAFFRLLGLGRGCSEGAELFEVVGDGEGAVADAFGADALGPEGEGEVGPVVVAFLQFLPAGLEVLAPLGQAEELPQGSGGDQDAVVEVGLPLGGPFLDQGVEVAQFGEQVAAGRQGLAGVYILLQALDFTLQFLELALDDVQAMEEGLVVEAVVVDPQGVAAGGGRQGPVDRRLAAALGVAFEVIGEEGAGFAEVVAQGSHPEEVAGFLLDGGGALLPNQLKARADALLQVEGVIGIVDEDAVPRELHRVIGGQIFGRHRQAGGVLQHAGRAVR